MAEMEFVMRTDLETLPKTIDFVRVVSVPEAQPEQMRIGGNDGTIDVLEQRV